MQRNALKFFFFFFLPSKPCIFYWIQIMLRQKKKPLGYGFTMAGSFSKFFTSYMNTWHRNLSQSTFKIVAAQLGLVSETAPISSFLCVSKNPKRCGFVPAQQNQKQSRVAKWSHRLSTCCCFFFNSFYFERFYETFRPTHFDKGKALGTTLRASSLFPSLMHLETC